MAPFQCVDEIGELRGPRLQEFRNSGNCGNFGQTETSSPSSSPDRGESGIPDVSGMKVGPKTSRHPRTEDAANHARMKNVEVYQRRVRVRVRVLQTEIFMRQNE